MQASSCYPNEVCAAHFGECRDADGNSVMYGTTKIVGRFASYHIVEGRVIERCDGVCYVQGRRCLVTEQYFGGLVIELQ